MACACERKGKPKCIWCKEAEAHKIPKERHGCSEYGGCN